MSKREEADRRLAEVILGAAVIERLERRGICPRLILEGADDPERELAELVDVIAARASHQNRLATMGELGAGVVHEARNQITSIRGFADIARHRNPSPELLELLERIFDQTKLCSESLSVFLGFVRRADDDCGPFDVNAAIGKAAVLARHQLEIHQVKLRIERADELPAAHGSASQLTQVLVNLAINAQQAMTGPGVVAITSRQGDGGRVVVEVADDGPGVPVELREQIFEPFFTTKPPERGTGLGLAICSQLVRSWDADLEVGDSDLGGALFTIALAPALEEES